MQLLLRQVKIVDPSSPHHHSVKDILVDGAHIVSIRNRISSENAQVYNLSGWSICPGFVDIGAYCGEPGEEYVESYDTLANRAIKGGFTHVAPLPNTSPRIQSASEISYLKCISHRLPIDIVPLGCITQDDSGDHLAEMIDMRLAGAVAFTDGLHPVKDVGVMHRAMEYARSRDLTLINKPLESNLKGDGVMHEGAISVSLGLKGIPRLSEVIMVKRDLDLLRYTHSKSLVACISCRESVELIRAAKSDGLNVYASVAALNLVDTAEALNDFDVNFKVLPPLREESDRLALIDGVLDGTIDCICSNHRPLAAEQKKVEFAYAEFGALGLETCFHLALNALGRRRKPDTLVDRLAIKPRSILGLPRVEIRNGGLAQLAIFRTDETTTLMQSTRSETAKNDPYRGRTMEGKIYGIVSKGNLSVTSN